MKLFRSYLFAPGSNEKLLEKVFSAGADAVVLDLEDAVSPPEKDRARELVSGVMAARAGHPGPGIFIRVNAVGSPWWREDIAAIVGPGLAGIRVPKSETPAQMAEVDRELSKAEERMGLRVGSTRVVCTIETAAGILAATDLARAPRVHSFTFGAADFILDTGIEPDPTETQTLFARSLLVLASRAAGISPPVATVFTRIKDLEGLRASTLASRQLGYFGRSCIHPTQIPIVNEIFTPSESQLERARLIVATFDAAEQNGLGVATTPDGEFIDLPIVERSRALLALAANLA